MVMVTNIDIDKSNERYLEKTLANDSCQLQRYTTPELFFEDQMKKYRNKSDKSLDSCKVMIDNEWYDFARGFQEQSINQQYVSEWYKSRLQDIRRLSYRGYI